MSSTVAVADHPHPQNWVRLSRHQIQVLAWQDQRMDATHYARLDELLRGLLIHFGDRLPPEETVDLANCLDRGLYGLALEWLADGVTELGLQVDADERAEILRLARLMGISEYVERALD